MSCKKLDICWIIKGSVIFVLTTLSGILLAQKDTIPHHFKIEFNSNISALNKLYCWNNNAYLEGQFNFNDEVDFAKELKKNTIFSGLNLGAKEFYSYLQTLSIAEKQNLIRYFSFHQSFFENELKKKGLSPDLKYLAPTISAMNPLAIGENKQAGIWHLKHFQGVINGLIVNQLVDERFNERLATKTAVKQLKQNHAIFGSTELAIIAYLVGNTKLQNTIRRCGAEPSLSEILNRLPVSLTETIAAYQAISVFLRTNSFNSAIQIKEPDVVSVNRQLHFTQVSKVLGISEKQLLFLNPQFRYSIVPADKNVLSLNIPNGKRNDFVVWLDSIYNAYDSTFFQVITQKIEYPPAPNRQYVGEKVKDLEIEGKTKIKYTIKSGDVLGFIAEDYDVRVADLKYWNNIYNERRIQAGQKLDIFVDDENAEYYSKLQQTVKKKTVSPNMVKQLTQTSPLTSYKVTDSVKKVEHIVKNGESPYVIAKKYKGITPEQILEWNGIKDARKIQIGQKLIIYLDKE